MDDSITSLQDEIVRLKNTNDQCKQRIATLENEIMSLLQKNHFTHEEIISIIEEKHQVDTLKEKLYQSQQENQQLRIQLSEYQSEASDSNLHDLSKRFIEQQSQLSSSHTELAALNHKLAEVQAENANIFLENLELKSRLSDKEAESIESEIKQKEIRSQVHQLKSMLHDIQKHKSSQAESFKGTYTSVQKPTIEQFSTHNSKSQRYHLSNRSKDHNYSESYEQLRRKIDSLTQDKNNLQKEIQQLQIRPNLPGEITKHDIDILSNHFMIKMQFFQAQWDSRLSKMFVEVERLASSWRRLFLIYNQLLSKKAATNV